MSAPRIAVIGGGLGGAAAALALHRCGFEVAVYEKSAELGEIGAGLNLSPNALKAFRYLGIEDAALRTGCQAEEQIIRSFRSGRVIARPKRSGDVAARYGAPFLTMHRADLLSLLIAPLPDRVFHLGAECTGAETRAGGAVAHFADGTSVEADIVIGADGIHSAVRDSVFGHIEPRFTGCICWRGLVPGEALPDPGFARQMVAWWGPHGHVVHYPVRRAGGLVNFVAHYDSDGWTGESWTHECDRSELLETYARWNPALLGLIEASDKYYKGRCTTGTRSTDGHGGGSRCLATRPTRCCPIWVRAPAWPSRTAAFSRERSPGPPAIRMRRLPSTSGFACREPPGRSSARVSGRGRTTWPPPSPGCTGT